MTRSGATVVLAGLALGMAFPRPGLHLLAWVAIVPLLLAVRGRAPMSAWWLGLAYGFAFRAVTLYWLVGTMTRFGDVAMPIALAAAILLMLYLATFQGLFAVVVNRVGIDDLGSVVLAAMSWVGLEYLQGWFLSGFPWGYLGYAGGATTLLGQGASIAGVYGLGFLVILVNLALADQVLRGWSWRPTAMLTAVMLALVTVHGAWRLRVPVSPDAAESIRVGLVQGNVPQDLKWDATVRDALLDRHLDLSRRAALAGVDLVIWPESSWPDPYGLERDPLRARRLGELATAHETALLVGTVHVQGDREGELEVSNSALLFAPTGGVAGRYDKARLVPFGEYLPLRSLLRGLGPIVRAVGSLRPGAADQPLLAIPGRLPPFGVAICYEIVFPGIARRHVAAGARFLVTITNDAWFGTTSGPYQHFAMARLRAIESDRWLVRAANTGISGVIDPRGRVLERSRLEQEASLTAVIGARSSSTLYVRTGDLFARICLLVAAVALAAALFPGRFGWLLERGSPAHP